MDKDEVTDIMPKRRVSIPAIVEILILLLGTVMSMSSTIKPLRYTAKYVWCFVFPILGVGLIMFLILTIRKKLIWLFGLFFIIFYLFVGGYGAFVCELNASRLKRVQFYEGKEVMALIDGVTYSWDGESVTYDYEGLEYIDPAKDVKVLVNGEEKRYGVLGSADSLDIYIEIYGGGTGIFLKLAPSEQFGDFI